MPLKLSFLLLFYSITSDVVKTSHQYNTKMISLVNHLNMVSANSQD